MDGDHHSHMGSLVAMRQIVALKLVDEKNIAGFEFIHAVVYEELLAPGDGKIDLIAVVDVNTHSFLVAVQPGDGKRFCIQTGLDRRLTGIMNQHGSSFYVLPII